MIAVVDADAVEEEDEEWGSVSVGEMSHSQIEMQVGWEVVVWSLVMRISAVWVVLDDDDEVV